MALLDDLLATTKSGVSYRYAISYPQTTGKLDIIPTVIPTTLTGVTGVVSWTVQRSARLATGEAGRTLMIQTNSASNKAADTLRATIFGLAQQLKTQAGSGAVTVARWQVELNVL